MKSFKIKKMKLLEIIEEEGAITQRDIGKKLDISLGSVNSMIQNLCKNGYFKLESSQKSKYNYKITAKGMSEKEALTHQYVQYSLNHYKFLRSIIFSLIKKLDNLNHKNIAIYGTNEFAEIVYIAIKESNLNFVGIIDNENAGKQLFGKTVLKSSGIQTNKVDALIVTFMETKEKVVIQEIKSLFPSDKVYSLGHHLKINNTVLYKAQVA